MQQLSSAEYHYRVAVVGDSGTGKSSLINCLMGKPFTANIMPSLAVEFDKYRTEVRGNPILLEFWQGTGNNGSMKRHYLSSAKAVIFVYDITNKRSFANLEYHWFKAIAKVVDDKEELPVFVIGNKLDLKKERQVSTELLGELSSLHNVNAHYEVSAKDCDSVKRIFEQIAKCIANTNLSKPHVTMNVPISSIRTANAQSSRNTGTLQSTKSGTIQSKSNTIMSQQSSTNSIRLSRASTLPQTEPQSPPRTPRTFTVAFCMCCKKTNKENKVTNKVYTFSHLLQKQQKREATNAEQIERADADKVSTLTRMNNYLEHLGGIHSTNISTINSTRTGTWNTGYKGSLTTGGYNQERNRLDSVDSNCTNTDYNIYSNSNTNGRTRSLAKNPANSNTLKSIASSNNEGLTYI